ncbi:MAG: DUF669 domain-containing protein [Thermoguttaceae bacterium]|nr:DUF669 domain-containing protein [Thermoguttaceae bacterium]
MVDYWNPDAEDLNDDFLSDFDDVQGVEIVPAGKYTGILTGWKSERNKNNKPCIVLTCQIVEGVYSGRTLLYYRYWTVKAKPDSKVFFDSMGIDPRRSVNDYEKIWIEFVATVQDGADGRQYTNVQTVRRIVPPEGQTTAQTSNPAPGSGQQSELPPGAF